jgi:CysZ protein
LATSVYLFAVHAEKAMIEAAVKALRQVLSPDMRAVLLKAIGLALAMIAVVAIVLYRIIAWFAAWGGTSLEGALGTAIHVPLGILAWLLSIAAGFGLIVGAIFLMPAVTALVGSFFVDEIAEHVEQEHYAFDGPGQTLPFTRALWEGVKAALLAVLVYLCATPFLLLAGFGAVIFFLASAFLLGREYFELAAMRFRSPEDAKALRKRHATTVFVAGLFIAAFVSIPIVNLATPLFGMAFMVHMHKRLSGPRPELIERIRR